ncbi:MAG: hypothetical protein GX590_05045, partial [Lentisphaerae bacterium]|nr:hypothetical protein [Lentisphaerota bacterium]
EGRLHVPVAGPAGETGGYWVSSGGGRWEYVTVVQAPVAFLDIARYDGRTFLAGSSNGTAMVAWRADGATDWHIEPLNAQAARFSFQAVSLLAVPERLSLLAVRDVIGDWPPTVAPRDWGAWYLLHYTAGKSPRGFLFDGPARPLPALRLLAPGSSLAQNPKVMLARDTVWQDGLLAVLLHETDRRPDPQGSLMAIALGEGTPQTGGRTFVGRRLAGMEQACDVAVADGRCHVLLADGGIAPRGRIATSADLETWETRFDAELPATPLALAVLDGRTYLGLADGRLVQVAK